MDEQIQLEELFQSIDRQRHYHAYCAFYLTTIKQTEMKTIKPSLHNSQLQQDSRIPSKIRNKSKFIFFAHVKNF
jgi:hypothetical protein